MLSSGAHHVRRQSGSAGGSFIAESLGFGRSSLNSSTTSSSSTASASSVPQSRSPLQQRMPPYASLQQQTMHGSLSFKLDPQQQLQQQSSSVSSSASSSSSSSSASTPNSRSSPFMNQIAHAQAQLNSLKQRSAAASQHQSPLPPPTSSFPSSMLQSTPSTLSSSLSSPLSSASASASSSSHAAPQPHPHPHAPPSHLKMKRKIRKNTREKQRRSELNDKFDSLQELLQLGGGQTKVEKYSVLSEAISVIEMLRKDNADLKAEQTELRREVRSMRQVLEGAFPHQPELAQDFTRKFFPALSALSPSQAGFGVGDAAGFSFNPSGFHSGNSSAASTPSNAFMSSSTPTGYLLSAMQQQQQQQQGQQGQQGQGGAAPSSFLPSAVPSSSAAQKPPSHRRGNSRNGSSSSINFQYAASTMPGFGLPLPQTPTTVPSINGFHAGHLRKPSPSIPSSQQQQQQQQQHQQQHRRTPSLKEELKMIDPFIGSRGAAVSSSSNMAISPTGTGGASYPFQSVFPSALTSLSSSASSSHHHKQPSQDFKFSLSSLNSLQTLHGLSPSPPPAASASSASFHQRGLSGSNFNVNLNFTLPQPDDPTVLPFDSPSAVGLFSVGAGGGMGAGGAVHGHAHHSSTGSLGGWVQGVTGVGDGQGMDDVAGGEYQ